MAETRIQLSQIVGLDSSQTLSTHLTNLDNNVGFFGGQVDNVSALSGITPVQDMHVFIKSDNKWVRYNGSSWVDISGGSGSSTLSGLSDVSLTSPSDGQVLTYDSTTSSWVAETPSGDSGGASTLGELTDVTISSASIGQVLQYDGSSWGNSQLSISNVSDLQTTLDGKASSNHTHNISDVSGLQDELDTKAESLTDLSDVSASSPTDGQVLTYNALTSSWVAETPSAGGGSSDLDGLSDVQIDSPTMGQVIVYNGTTWLNDDLSISGVDGLQTALDEKAPLNSPNLTGTPTAPTATTSDNSTQIATTAFVYAVIAEIDGGTF